MPASRSLNNLQQWMQTVITHPDGIGAGIRSADAAKFLTVTVGNIEQVILPSSDMNSLDRLQIYGRAYFGRLIECLRAQFPSVRHAIGDEAFDGLAFGYLIHHPSTNYTLGTLGDSFDAFLETTRPPRPDETEPDQPDFADFLIDLARLERIFSEVFHGKGPESSRSLEPSEFDGLSAVRFADCRLVPHACVRLVELRFPVHEYISAIRKETEPAPPTARPVCLVVTRRDYVVRRYEITRPQFTLLSAIIGQSTIGQALEILLSDSNVDIASLKTDLRTWFRDWSAAPLFAEFVSSESLDV